MDALQQQLDQLMRLFHEEQAANRAHREEMATRIDAISQGSNGGNGGGNGNGGNSGNNRNGGSTIPRYAKLDFPKFNGTEDPLGWLSRCDHFFTHQNTPEAAKVGLASFHLEGNAQLWFLQLQADFPGLTWTDFTAQCHLRFGPPIRSNKLGELAKLKQTGTVAEYQNQFEILASRAGNLSPSQKIQLYLSGLQDHISVEVELHHPQDLASAMSMSRLYERRGEGSSSSLPTPTAATTQATDRQIKRLTPAEMLDRRRKGLCFNCEEPFVRGHQCAKLFWFELVDPDPPDADQPVTPGT